MMVSGMEYVPTFADKAREAFELGKIKAHEMKAVTKLYNSGKRIDAQKQLDSYCKRRGRVRA